ncbi:MAG: hypothetical protein RIS36_2190 [Pseudomonadota bacterium]|jgi:hypothetical protein
MPRSEVTCSQRGAVSLLVAAFVLPILFVLLSIGIEVSGFFGAREEVLEQLDAELLAALRGGRGDDAIAERVQDRLSALRSYLVVEDVRVDRRGASIEGRIRARYRGPLVELASHLTGVAPHATSMEVVSFVRRPRSAVLFVLDRTLAEGNAPCGDPALSARVETVMRSVDRFKSAEGVTVRIAVLPGFQGEIDILGGNDGVARCPGSDPSGESARYVQGTPVDELPDPLSAAVRIVDGVIGLSATSPLEQRAVIMVSKGKGGGAEIMTTALSLIEHEAVRQRVSIQGIGIAVTDSDEEGEWTVKSASGRSSYLQVSAADAQAATFVTALVHHTQGRAVIAR